jgi:hypothetical protein
VRGGRRAAGAACALAAALGLAAGCGGSPAPSTTAPAPPPLTPSDIQPSADSVTVRGEYRPLFLSAVTALHSTGLGLIGGSADPAALQARGRQLSAVLQRLARALETVERAPAVDGPQGSRRRRIASAGRVAVARLDGLVDALSSGDPTAVRAAVPRARDALMRLVAALVA